MAALFIAGILMGLVAPVLRRFGKAGPLLWRLARPF